MEIHNLYENVSESKSEIIENIEHEEIKTPIQEFYKKTNVFITGGTGFLGKILIEKLLRSCPDIQTIYILVRAKKGKSIDTRVEEMFDDILFNRLKSECSKFRHKIEPVQGDCSMPGLGLSVSDRRMLLERIDLVFHVAATVRFDENLRLAMAINVNATRDLLNMCKQMIHLKSVVHVSTVYCNCPNETIEEKFYSMPNELDDLDLMLSKLDDRQIDEITPKILGVWPNTYTFTKALAENVVRDYSKGVPVAVFRPAIVISTWQEPMPGWIDNFLGSTGVAAGAYSGVMRTLHNNGYTKANIVPADMCVNAIIACAWDVAKNKQERNNDEIPVYNYVSTTENPITWSEYCNINSFYSEQYPYSKAMWCLNFRLNSNKLMYAINVLLLHLFPAVILDTIATIFGKQRSVLKIYKKIHKFSDVISYFCIKDWTTPNDNIQTLWKKISKQDKKIFFFSMGELDWFSYFKAYIKGIRIYLLKDPLSTLERAQKRYKKLVWIERGLKLLLSYLLVCILVSLFSRILFG